MVVDCASCDIPAYEAPLAVLDFETTWEGEGGGTDCAQHPVEAAVLHGTMGGPWETVLSTRIRPPVPIRPEATECHGITDAVVAGAPTAAEVMPSLSAALRGRVLVAFNLPFEWTVLGSLAWEHGRERVPLSGFCPLAWARLVQRYDNGKTLSDVARRFGIPFWAHGAEEDCRATAAVLLPLLRLLHRGGRWWAPTRLATVSDVWRATAQCGLEADSELAEFKGTRGEQWRGDWIALLGDHREEYGC